MGVIAFGFVVVELMYEKELCGWYFGYVGFYFVWMFVGVMMKMFEMLFVYFKDVVDVFIDECV